jgi:DNA-binding response OmpR family regulator
MKILIIEDEKNLVDILKKGLEENSFIVDSSFDGEEGLYMAETFTYDAIILDIMLPKVDGLTVLDKLRERKIDVPVLLLTARGEVEDRVKGLNIGADDYIVKPFEFSELIARLRAVIRRTKGKATPLIKIDDLIIDTNSGTVKRNDKEIKLSAKEYNILEYLALNKGRIISRTEIIEHIYAMDFDLDSNVIDVYINYLRNKIDRDYSKKLIHTVRGAGYILKEFT